MNLDYQVPLPYYHTNQYRAKWAEKLNFLISEYDYANKLKFLAFLHLLKVVYAVIPYSLDSAFQH